MNIRREDQLLQRTLWAGALTGATIASTVLLGCATPFAALIVLAVLFLPRKDAFWLVGANWLLNQAVGFGLMHWPLTLNCFLGGVSLAVGCAACTAAAVVVHRYLRRHVTAMVIGGFLAGFVAFEIAIGVAEGWRSHEAVDVQTYLYILYVNGIAFAGLLALQGAATSLGLAGRRQSAPSEAIAGVA